MYTVMFKHTFPCMLYAHVVYTDTHVQNNTDIHLFLWATFLHLQTSRDGDRFVQDLKHSIARNTAFDCVMRVRASTGLRPTGFFGGFFMQNTTDVEFGNMDADKAIAVEIKHDDKLKEDEIAFFQVGSTAHPTPNLTCTLADHMHGNFGEVLN